jgi:hypothetical protein
MRCDELEGIFDGNTSAGRVTTPLSIAGKLKEKVRKVTQDFSTRSRSILKDVCISARI